MKRRACMRRHRRSAMPVVRLAARAWRSGLAKSPIRQFANRRWLPLCALAALALSSSHVSLGAAAQSADPQSLESRLERLAGMTSDAAADFLATLRKAVGQNDPHAACALLSYPLPHASGTLNSSADCESRYDLIFTVPVRRAIGRQQFKELFASDRGVMIGLGEVWFAANCKGADCKTPDIRVRSIVSDGTSLVPPDGKVLMACNVAGWRLNVTADGAGAAALRLWPSNNPVGTPSTDIPHGLRSTRGRTNCASPVWTFTNSSSNYVVAEVGCPDDQDPPPMGSVARVTRTLGASPTESEWCRE
jgi:hypothetical protein